MVKSSLRRIGEEGFAKEVLYGFSISQSIPMLGGRTSYQKFVLEDSIGTVSGIGVRDMKNIPLKPWDRMGGYGVYIDLDGTILKGEATVGQTNNAYICEIPPGKSLTPRDISLKS